MNFGEKLTNLRKQKGLSQEELGYELNVTRQTVSKWELGQTTPEMDKLLEISRIFGTSVDELTNNEEISYNEVERIEDRPTNEKQKNNSTLKVILLIIAIFIIGGMIFAGFILSKFFNFGKEILDDSREMRKEIIEGMGDVIDTGVEGIEDITNENIIKENEQIKNQVEDLMKEQAGQIQQEVYKQKENSKGQEELLKKAEEEQQQMLQQYKQQEQQVNEQMEKIKEQMSPEQKEWFEQAQKEQQQMLQQQLLIQNQR